MSYWKAFFLHMSVLVLFVLLLGVSPWIAYPFFIIGRTWVTFAECPESFVKLLCWALRTREIHKPEGLYLRRFYLSPRWSWLPFQIFLHNIRLDDSRNPEFWCEVSFTVAELRAMLRAVEGAGDPDDVCDLAALEPPCPNRIGLRRAGG